jgi:hypothetical protein
MGILPQYPVYQRARELGLPEFVFGVDHVRWIIWRSAWEPGPGYAISDVLREIAQRGGKITVMTEMEETVWEIGKTLISTVSPTAVIYSLERKLFRHLKSDA